MPQKTFHPLILWNFWTRVKYPVQKYKDWKSVPQDDATFWHSKTPLERLKAALLLNNFVRKLQEAARNGRDLPEIPRIVKRIRG